MKDTYKRAHEKHDKISKLAEVFVNPKIVNSCEYKVKMEQRDSLEYEPPGKGAVRRDEWRGRTEKKEVI